MMQTESKPLSLSSSIEIQSFDSLDIFNDSLDFGTLIPDDYVEDRHLFGDSVECQRSTTLDVLQETIQICDGLDDDFGCSWSSINESFPAPTEISEDEQTTTSSCSSDSEIDVIMQKLNSCMERSAETRKHVEKIAEELKKNGLHPSAAKTSKSGVVQKRRLPTSKKASKQVKKRKDFAVTGCLVRPVLLEKAFTVSPMLTPKPKILVSKAPQKKAGSSIADFLRKNKR